MKTICIIGGGPVGLNAYIKFKERGYIVKLFEAEDHLGGQLTNFYPNKVIDDISDIKPIEAKSYLNILISHLDWRDIFLNTKISKIEAAPQYKFYVTIDGRKIIFDYVILAVGLGFPVPRKIGLEGEDNCDNILYIVKDINVFKDKDVVIFGGGDSALDWTKSIYPVAKSLTLVHRRDEFRGNENTIKDIKDKIHLYLSYIPFKLDVENGKAKSIDIKSVKDQSVLSLKCDYIICNYGTTSFVDKFMFSDTQGSFITCDNHCETKIKNLFAIGDIADYKDKKRRIQAGIEEIQKVFNYIDSKS